MFVLKIVWRKSLALLHRLTQDVQRANLRRAAGDPTWVFDYWETWLKLVVSNLLKWRKVFLILWYVSYNFIHSVSEYKKWWVFSSTGLFLKFPVFSLLKFLALQGRCLIFSRFSPWFLKFSKKKKLF